MFHGEDKKQENHHNTYPFFYREEKISVALLVNVLHYREEEKLDIVESRASVIGCRSMRRWQRSLLCAE